MIKDPIKYSVHKTNSGIESLSDPVFKKDNRPTLARSGYNDEFSSGYFDAEGDFHNLPLAEVVVYPEDVTPNYNDQVKDAYRNTIINLRRQGYNYFADQAEAMCKREGVHNALGWCQQVQNRQKELMRANNMARVVAEKQSLWDGVIQLGQDITKVPKFAAKQAWDGITWFGGKLLDGMVAFGNAQIAGDSGAGTSAAIASGYEYNRNSGKWEQSEERLNDPSVKALRDNLEVLSTFSETHPYSILAKGLGYLWKWRPFLPKGSETTVYRQGGMDMIDDALESGVIRPQPEANYTAKVAADKAAGNRILLRKQFKEVMFNRQKPFYGNPGLFEKSYKGVFVGDMNKSSAQWIQNFHKNHKNIFEPFIDGVRSAPVSEFNIYTRAPYGFGWFKNSHNISNLPLGIIPQTIINNTIKNE